MWNQIFQFLFQIIFRFPCICLFDYWVILKVGKFFRTLFLKNMGKTQTWKFTYKTATPANCKNTNKMCTYVGPWAVFLKFYLTFTIVSYNKRLSLMVIEQGLKRSCIFNLQFQTKTEKKPPEIVFPLMNFFTLTPLECFSTLIFIPSASMPAIQHAF